jgi:signal transduction histidine kinase
MLGKLHLLILLGLLFAGGMRLAKAGIPDSIQIEQYYEKCIRYKQVNGGNHTYNLMLDTLKKRLDLAADDELCRPEYLVGLNFFAKEISLMHPDSAQRLLREVVIMARNCDVPTAQAGAIHELGVLYASQGLDNIALEYFIQSLDLFKGLNDWIANGYAIMDIGNIYFKLGKFGKARQQYVSAEQTFMQGAGEGRVSDMMYALAVCRNNLGLIEMEEGGFARALAHFREAYTLRQEAGFYMYLPHSAMYIARALDSLGLKDSARMEISLALALDSIHNAGSNEGDLLLYLGVSSLEKDPQGALQYFREAMQIATAMNNYSLLQEALRGIAVYYEDSHPDSSLHYYTRVFQLAEEQHNNDLKESIAGKLVSLYEKHNDFEKQNQYLRVLNALLQQRLNESVLKSELSVEEQRWQKERLHFLERIQRKDTLSYSLIFLAVLFLAFMIVVITNRLRIKRKSEELHQLNQELNRTLEHRDKIYAIIAHDLRGPIGTSKQILEIIQDPNLNSEQKDRFIATVKDAISSSYGLLDNLLNWANLKLRNLNLQPALVEMHPFVGEQQQIYNDLIKSKNIHLKNDIRPGTYAYFDRNTLSTVIRNLISNAVKYSDEGKTIAIYTSNSPGKVQLHIRDEGVGMSAETLRKVMSDEAFYTQKGTRNESGSGLGLKLCKEFTEINKGSLRVSSEPGKGTHFTVELPVDPGIAM